MLPFRYFLIQQIRFGHSDFEFADQLTKLKWN